MTDLPALERLARQFDVRFGRRGARLESGFRRPFMRNLGPSFAAHRPYEPGDDVRTIDWNVTARAGQPFVKVTEEERAGQVIIAVDVSRSMRLAPVGSAKWRAEFEVAALCAFSAALRDERVGAVAFTDRIEWAIPSARGRQHAAGLLRSLWALEPHERRTELNAVFAAIDTFVVRPALVIAISDFVDTGYGTALRRLTRRHDVIGISIDDQRQRDLARRRLVTIEDVESGARQTVDSSSASVQRALRERWATIDRERQATFAAAAATLVTVDAGENWLDDLMSRRVAAPSVAAV